MSTSLRRGLWSAGTKRFSSNLDVGKTSCLSWCSEISISVYSTLNIAQLKANLEASEEDRLPESEVIAQMATLVFAGTDSALDNCLYWVRLLLTPSAQPQPMLSPALYSYLPRIPMCKRSCEKRLFRLKQTVTATWPTSSLMRYRHVILYKFPSPLFMTFSFSP
jgi:hypothetical protein